MSQGTTLEAGSIILSGSPPPLDRAKDPNPFLAHGDEVRCYVQGLGSSTSSSFRSFSLFGQR